MSRASAQERCLLQRPHLVACRASSARFPSFPVSVAPPTLMTATPPDLCETLPGLLFIVVDVVSSIWALICCDAAFDLLRVAMAFRRSWCFFVDRTRLAQTEIRQRRSRASSQRSSLITWPPGRDRDVFQHRLAAIASPGPSPPTLSGRRAALLTTKGRSGASPSTSSAMMISGRCPLNDQPSEDRREVLHAADFLFIDEDGAARP